MQRITKGVGLWSHFGFNQARLGVECPGSGVEGSGLLDVYRDVLRAKARPCVGERSSLETGKLV